jgi:hypothetical protein
MILTDQQGNQYYFNGNPYNPTPPQQVNKKIMQAKIYIHKDDGTETIIFPNQKYKNDTCILKWDKYDSHQLITPEAVRKQYKRVNKNDPEIKEFAEWILKYYPQLDSEGQGAPILI